jgi:hypothetical protein
MQNIVGFLLVPGQWNKDDIVGKKECESVVVKWKRSLEMMLLHPHMCSSCHSVNTLLELLKGFFCLFGRIEDEYQSKQVKDS